MKSIFKHPEKIDISSIADNEASKTISFLFMIHKSFCGDCKKVFKNYQTLGLKIAKSFDKKLVNTRSEKIFKFYSATLKAAVYALVVGIPFSSVGIAFAQTQTDLDIIPDVTFFEDGEIISFSEEECTKRIRAQFNTLKNAKIQHVVLGAHGCGAFLNPPKDVARIYKSVIEEFEDNFKIIAFAIFNAGYGPDNYSIFKAILNER